MNSTNSASTELSSPFVGQPINDAARAIFSTLGTVMILCGVTGSGLLITVLLRRFRRKQYVHDLFLANLAVVDLLLLGYCVSSLILDVALGFHPVVNQTHCVANGIIVYTLNVVCILTLLAISLNRYLHVCHFQLCKRFFTLSRTAGAIVCIWLVGICVALPPALGVERGYYTYSPHTHVCSFSRKGVSYAKVMVISLTTIPMFFIGCCNFAIFRFWKKAKMNVDKWKAPGGQGKLFTKHPEGVRKSRGIEVTADEEQGNPPILGSKQNVPMVCIDTPRTVEESERHHSQIENFAGDPEDRDEYIQSSQIHVHSSNDDNGNKDWNSTSRPSSTDANCHQKQAEHEQYGKKTKMDRKHRQTNLMPENDSIAMTPSSQNNARLTEDSCATGATRHSLMVSSNPPSASTVSSPGKPQKTRSAGSPQKHIVTTAFQNCQLQKKKQHAREVAFVRSLFVVFMLSGISFVPYVTIMALSSKVMVPSEIAILGILLLYTNSSVNWIVYGVMNPSFRKAYRESGQQLLGFCCQGRQEQADSHQTCSQSSETPVAVQKVKAESEAEQSSSLVHSDSQSSV